MGSSNHLSLTVHFLPRDLNETPLPTSAVVVFDVLRATTSISAALAEGVKSIRVFPTTAAVLNARSEHPGALLCGEERCLAPPGFDLGNSPGAFKAASHANRELLMSTTNGTRAIIAATGAKRIYAGALVNADAVANCLLRHEEPIVLLCAGTNGATAMEDMLGAGAVIASLRKRGKLHFENDAAIIADRLFSEMRSDLPAALRTTRGGLNLIEAGLETDIDFAAKLSVLHTVGLVSADSPPIITACY